MKMRIIPTLLAVGLTLVVFTAWALGPLHLSGVKMGSDGGMGTCLLMPGESSLCTMSVPEHLALFQSAFTVIPQRMSAFALLAFVASMLGIAIRWRPSLVLGNEGSRSAAWLRRLQEHLDIALLDPLKRALAHGILHPKTF